VVTGPSSSVLARRIKEGKVKNAESISKRFCREAESGVWERGSKSSHKDIGKKREIMKQSKNVLGRHLT